MSAGNSNLAQKSSYPSSLIPGAGENQTLVLSAGFSPNISNVIEPASNPQPSNNNINH